MKSKQAVLHGEVGSWGLPPEWAQRWASRVAWQQGLACQCRNADSIPGSGRPPGGGTGTPSSVLAWGTPWAQEPGGHNPWGHKESDTTEHLHSALRVVLDAVPWATGLNKVSKWNRTCNVQAASFSSVGSGWAVRGGRLVVRAHRRVCRRFDVGVFSLVLWVVVTRLSSGFLPEEVAHCVVVSTVVSMGRGKFRSLPCRQLDPGGSAGKESTCNAGDPGSIPGLGRSPREELGNPLQCSWASLVA